MKYSKYLWLAALTFGLNACDDAEYDVIENGVYLAEAAPDNKFNQQVESALVDETDYEQKLTVRLVKACDQEVKATLDVDNALLEAYNARNGTEYKMLDASNFEFSSKEAVIAPGNVLASDIVLKIKPYDNPNDESFAIPVKIASVSGSSLVGNSNKLILLLRRPLKQKSVVMTGYAATSRVTFNSPIGCDNWTFEFWLKVNWRHIGAYGYPIMPWEGPSERYKRAWVFGDNAAPFELQAKDGEFMLLRYWADGVKQIAPTLQNQLNGVYFDSEEFWYPDVWYHIAYTFDGQTMKLYKDGVLNAKKDASKAMTFTGMALCQSYTPYMETEFAQIRLWKKCLNPSDIQEGMSRNLPVDSEGLAGYWKCGEGEGSTLYDSTSNANHIQINSNCSWSAQEYNYLHPND